MTGSRPVTRFTLNAWSGFLRFKLACCHRPSCVATEAMPGRNAVHYMAQRFLRSLRCLGQLSRGNIQGIRGDVVTQTTLNIGAIFFEDISLRNLAGAKLPNRGCACATSSS
jgi:hypothetical protein